MEISNILARIKMMKLRLSLKLFLAAFIARAALEITFLLFDYLSDIKSLFEKIVNAPII